MKCAIAALGIFVLSLTVSGQSLQCITVPGATPLLRAEGTTERVGDLIIQCSGGVPTPAGGVVPQVDIQIYVNANVTSRLLADPLAEALLLIDDPPAGAQAGCLPAPSATACQVTGVGGANGVSFGTGAAPNVYQGRLSGVNSIIWRGIPVDPPGANNFRTLRITNVRVNASSLPVSGGNTPTVVQEFLVATPPQVLPFANPQITVGLITPGLAFTLRTAADDAPLGATGAMLQQCQPNNLNTFNNSTAALTEGTTFTARFQEGFASSFAPRNTATALVGANYTADSSPVPGAQDSPGLICDVCRRAVLHGNGILQSQPVADDVFRGSGGHRHPADAALFGDPVRRAPHGRNL